MRANHGVSFVSSKSDLSPVFNFATAVMYAMLCYIGPCYNAPELYIFSVLSTAVGRHERVPETQTHRSLGMTSGELGTWMNWKIWNFRWGTSGPSRRSPRANWRWRGGVWEVSRGWGWVEVIIPEADSRSAPSQWETALLCNDVSHWLGASLESSLIP